MPLEKAVYYAERIRKARGNEVVDELFSKDDWRYEYCKAITYLPSRADVAEEQVRLHGRFFYTHDNNKELNDNE